MAQLPPKVPNVIPQDHHYNQQQWKEFMHHNRHHHQQQRQNPPWVDEFMEFSAARRGAHRRTMSDSSVAFVEVEPVPSLGSQLRQPEMTGRTKNKNDEEFDKFDDEQFMSMFSNELRGSSSNPSSTSDHNSTNEDRKRRTTVQGEDELGTKERVEDGEKVEEAESSCLFDRGEGKVQAQAGGGGSHNKGCNVATPSGNNDNLCGGDQQTVVDPKRVKRILANRQSAQRSRVRKLQYISELERSVTALQSEVSALSPRVAFLDHQRMILNVDNSTLKAKIAALAQDKIFKDAHQDAMKREIERLRQVYYQQNLNKTESIVPPPSSSSLPPTAAQPPPPDTRFNENEQLLG